MAKEIKKTGKKSTLESLAKREVPAAPKAAQPDLAASLDDWWASNVHGSSLGRDTRRYNRAMAAKQNLAKLLK